MLNRISIKLFIIILFAFAMGSYPAQVNAHNVVGAIGSGSIVYYGGFASVLADKEKGGGYRIGGEVSAVAFGWSGPFFGWIGVYTDLSYMYNREQHSGLWSIGPELGIFFFGVDGGLLVSKNKKLKTGATVRVHAAIPMKDKRFTTVMPFYRVNYFSKTDVVYEFGVIYKFSNEVK